MTKHLKYISRIHIIGFMLTFIPLISYSQSLTGRYEGAVTRDGSVQLEPSQGLNGNNWDWPKVYWQWRVQPSDYLNSITSFLENL